MALGPVYFFLTCPRRHLCRNWYRLLLLAAALWMCIQIVVYLLYGGTKFNNNNHDFQVNSHIVLREYVKPDNMTIRIRPQGKPCTEETFLVIIACSAVGNAEARNAIRQTWGSDTLGLRNVSLFFLLGSSNDTNMQEKVDEESQNYSDIIQEDFMDTYDNLTVKTVMMLKYVNDFCKFARYIVKSDDDVFLNVPNLRATFDEFDLPSNRFVLGSMFQKAVPLRDAKSKYFSPNSYSKSSFPTYLSGTLYVLTNDIVPELYKTALDMPYFRIEDVFLTGLCMARLNQVQHVHNPCFHYEHVPPEPCRYRRIVSSHRVNSTMLVNVWRQMHDAKLVCEGKLMSVFKRLIKPWYC